MQPDVHKIAKEIDVTDWKEGPVDDGWRCLGFLPSCLAAEKTEKVTAH